MSVSPRSTVDTPPQLRPVAAYARSTQRKADGKSEVADQGETEPDSDSNSSEHVKDDDQEKDEAQSEDEQAAGTHPMAFAGRFESYFRRLFLGKL